MKTFIKNWRAVSDRCQVIKQFIYFVASMITIAMGGCGGGASPSSPPPPSSYSIGGNVSGMTAGTLVLRNNGADDLNVSTNGAFTFKKALLSAAGYAVTVATQPANQNCTVANGSGTVSNANVTNVAVTCVAAPPPSGSGALDASFGTGGKVTTDFSGPPPAPAPAPIAKAQPKFAKKGG